MQLELLRRLREKWPELLLEAVSVVFAVLLALAVDEWRDGRASARRAEVARQGILEEAASNLAELENTRAWNVAMLEGLEEARQRQREEQPVGSIQADYEIALLSSSAWSTAQVTGAVLQLPYEWLQDVSRQYELQELFLDRQRDLVDFLGGAGVSQPGELKAFLTALIGRLRTVMRVHASLAKGYEELLQGGSPVSPTPPPG